VCHHEGGMFGGSAHVTLDVFVLGHPVINWGQCVWHVVGGGDPGRGYHACVRRGQGDILIVGRNSGRRHGSDGVGIYFSVMRKERRVVASLLLVCDSRT